ncbi:MAG: DUF349 domain-containing protein [Chromatiaceae bacterium]|nr:MAG: DUF349 domain-containing protein [Chromatiaceae bacterium]
MFLKRLFGKVAADAPAPVDQQTLISTSLTAPEVAARREACRQVNDLETLRRIAADDVDAGLRDLAGARFRRLLCGLDAQAPACDQRLALIAASDSQDLLKQVATHASEPQLRRAAIERLESPLVLAACAVDDALAANRLAAAERVQDRAALEQIAKAIGKRDKTVLRLVRTRLRALAEVAERPRQACLQAEALCERAERLGRFDQWAQDRAVLEHLDQQWAAVAADLPAAQAAALQDRYQALRARFLAGYEDYAAANAAQLAAAAAQAAASAARADLIAAVQATAQLEDLDQLQARLRTLAVAWTEAGAPLPEQAARLEREHRAALAVARAQQQRLQEGVRRRQAAARLQADAEALLAQGGAPERKALLALQRRLDALDPDLPERAPAAAAMARLIRRFEKHREQLVRRLADLPPRLAALDQHLQQGELRRAEPIYQSISATLDQARQAALPASELAPIEAHLKGIAPQLRELREWRRWSADEHRVALCAEVEALGAGAAQPLAVSARRLRELQQAWRDLERNGAPASEALWQRFRAAAEQVRARCQPYLTAAAERRAEVNRRRAVLCAEVEAFLEQVDWERIDWRQLARAEREMRQAWSALEADPQADNARPPGRLEGRFHRALRRIDKALAEERDRNQAAKRDLIARMQALAEQPDLRQAIEAAKNLQQQWQTTVAGRQRDENALWREFRAASDALFARRAAEQLARDAAGHEHQAARVEIIAAADDLLATAATTMALEGGLAALVTKWEDTAALPVPRAAAAALARQWQDVLARAEARRQALIEAERWAASDCLATHARCCDGIAARLIALGECDDAPALAEIGAALQAERAGLPPLVDVTAATVIEAAFAQLSAALTGPSAARAALAEQLAANQARRHALCLHLEIVAGVESPPALQTERMQVQVERLRGRISDGGADPLADATRLLRDWYLSTPASPSAELEARFARVRAALLQPLSAAQPATAPAAAVPA